MKKLLNLLSLFIILSISISGAALKLARDRSTSTSIVSNQEPAGNGSVASRGATPKTADVASTSNSEVAENPSNSPSSSSTVDSPVVATSFQKGEALTPFQLQLQEAIKQRRAAGLPVPSVTYEYQTSSKDAWKSITGDVAPSGNALVTSKTTIQFASPEQAGYKQWPALTYNKVNPSGGGDTVKVDYTE